MPHPYRSIAAQVFDDSDARSERLMRLLAEPDELVSVVLRGHLLLEELLFSACAAHCQEPEQLKAARLRFPQLISLLRALEKIPAAPPHYWEALSQFNSLRNALAHSLEPSDIEERISKLAHRLVPALPALGTKDKPPAPSEQLRAVVHFLVGGLEVVAVWQEAVEALMANQLQKPSGEGAA